MARASRVLIAGAGPVGLITALCLARRDVPVTVLEVEPHLTADLRAAAFHPPTLEMLEELGLTRALHEMGLLVPTWQFRDRETGVVAEFDLGLLKADTRFPYRLHCEQHKLTRVAHEMLSRGGTTLDAIGGDGPLAEARELTRRLLPPRDARITLAPNIGLKESVTLDIGSYKAFQPHIGSDRPLDPNVALYWKDVLKNSHVLPPMHVVPRTCWRFYFRDGSVQTQVRFDDEVHRGRRLYERLRAGAIVHGELRATMSADECALLDRLMVANFVVVEGPAGR